MLNRYVKRGLKKKIKNGIRGNMHYPDNSKNMFDNNDYLRHYNNNANTYNHSRRVLKIYVYTVYPFNRKKGSRGKMNGRGILKIGQTVRDDVHKYIKKNKMQGPYRDFILKLVHPVPFNSYNQYLYGDKKIHKILERKGVRRLDGEGFECSLSEVKDAINQCENR